MANTDVFIPKPEKLELTALGLIPSNPNTWQALESLASSYSDQQQQSQQTVECSAAANDIFEG